LQVGESVNLARALAATPPNVANPAHLVELAKRVAKETGMACKVIDAASARKLGMGGLVAVGQAGSTPPALIALEWNGGRPARQPGKGQGKAKAGPVLLVGKAITFDTGGYSLKDAKGMLGMKYDKCGGAAVLGAMHAIASLKLPVHVVGLIAAAENMVDSTAYRPNDIITHHNGVTCEITNTDAEGRLVLADALAYGCRTYRPAAVIDLATLTGGVIVALGSITAGLFCNHAQLRARVMDAGDDTGERLWHLPLWDEHRDLMRGSHSDLVNSSVKVDRDCHPIQGAAYLSYFVAPDADPSKPGSLPWAHIDIAGVANVKQGSALYEAGPTGWGVRLLTRLVEQWSPLDPES
jgi:leucyl aminopeptidase